MMYAITIILFILLCLSLLLSTIRTGRLAIFTKTFRWVITVGGIGFFSLWFFKKSFPSLADNSLSVQIINNLQQPIDFYTVRINKNADLEDVVNHLGIIRSGYYRIEYFNVKNSDEYWLMGFIGKKKLVYFSQHAVVNKNEDQLIEVRNYINQSQRLSDIGAKKVNAYVDNTVAEAVWVTLDFLLIFLNLVLLLRKKTLRVEH
ncbi:hypothetical protein [Elizabethkingia meningoseptica]|uniref:hypothetical protein n=1 Tax=Elizabethkingia meningoseptica TaxID=238 RepID=UPI00389204D1